MDAIKIENLTKKYKDVVAVDSLTLSVKRGELFSLLGVNGAGKTTTIKMLCGLTKASGGNAYINGKSINTDFNAVKPIIAVSPQETAVALGLTVYENLELFCKIYRLSKEESDIRIKKISETLGLNTIINKKASKLSGGWQRRLSIALALISKPQILFLDEPTLGLDVIARSELWDLINTLKGKITVILTTHYLEEAEALSDRVAIMKNGRLLICDTAENIKLKTCESNFEQAFIKLVRGV